MTPEQEAKVREHFRANADFLYMSDSELGCAEEGYLARAKQDAERIEDLRRAVDTGKSAIELLRAQIAAQELKLHDLEDGFDAACAGTAKYQAEVAELKGQIAAMQAGEAFGWYFSDDPAVYAMPGSGFSAGAERPENAAEAVPLYLAPPPAAPAENISCKSVQKRLATQWGYVKADEPPAAPVVPDVAPEIREAVLKIGKVQWFATPAAPDAAHLLSLDTTLRLTRESFAYTDDRQMHGLMVEGSEEIVAQTGVSPNSPNHAMILAGLWNTFHDQLAAAPTGETK